MEQIKELLEILKQTPEMALWGLGIYFFFILIKMASWITALTIVAKIALKRYFDYKDKVLLFKEEELKNQKGYDIAEFFEEKTIDSVNHNLVIQLLGAIQDGSYGYIHESDLRNAIKLIEQGKRLKRDKTLEEL